ncbi:extracellular ligand-binding receptor [Kalymmatonema gypsitolerans NIES-4073]|nr:extracellular ligand-binding receptor [Scytonema sp. NIES-4073]
MTYSTARRNPYIIGRPIDEPELIFGRESLFGFIEDNLRHNVKVIFLHGQRRMGKSSVLRNIPNFVAPDEFVFVPFDLQEHSRKPLSHILDALATEIIDHLELDSDKISLSSTTELEIDAYIFAHKFLSQIYKTLGDKKLVLLLDEFDALSNEDSDSVVENLFPYLHSIALEYKLFIILFAGRKSEDRSNLLSVFKEAPSQEIGFLDELSAKRLITKPALGVLEYDHDAIQAILELSAGHPYFTQIICFAIFGRARELQNWKVTREDVDAIVDKAIELAEAGLAWFWDGLSIPERVVFSAVAEAQRIAISNKQKIPEELLTLLKSYGVLHTEELSQARKRLAKESFLDDTGHRVKVELIRRWLVKRHPLQQEIWELEKLAQEKVNHLWEIATRLRQGGNKQNALALFEQILALNPNHFNTITLLAAQYLDLEDFDKAVELYTRAYQVDPIRYKQELLRALQSNGEKLLTQREYIRAKEQFNRVLEIEPKNPSAREKLLEIDVELEHKIEAAEPKNLVLFNQDSKYISHEKNYKNRSILFATIGALVGTIVLSVAITIVSRLLTSCSVNERNELKIGCVIPQSNNISRGQRTLFASIKNNNRDLGIEAFKQRKYSEAAEFFKRAVAANRNDPEVLIYYNNARAQQQNPALTLAVVVPVDNAKSVSQEILRGVAQAQNQFNEEGGLNGQLLEIAIADDGNEPDKAKQVAEQLSKDSSVLGVIGHNSSDTTKVAVAEYEKARLAIISPTNTINLVTSDVFFRTVPSDAATSKTLAEYVFKNLSLNKVVIFFNPKSLYSDSLREEFTKNVEKLGGQVIRKIDLTDPKLDVEKEVASSLFKYQAEAAVLFPDTQHISVALKIAMATDNLTARLRNPKRREFKLLGGDALYSDTTLKEGRNAVEGLIIAVPWFRETPQSKNFAQMAAQQWKAPISWRTATSFDATQAFIQALSPDPSRSRVLQRLRQTKLSPSKTSGDILQFTPDGERQSQPILVRVVGGKFELVKE